MPQPDAPSTGWTVARAVMAIALMVGFYLFALAVVAGLFWIPYAEWHYLGQIHFKLAAVCLGAGGAILWAVTPRPDHFEPPGPELTASAQPRLFTMIRDLAGKTAQAEPREVYLLPDVNAWVTQRGGVMGFGGRRVMGIGLPLLQSLSVSELRAVLAHEFGHYWGGDVAIGPWIYKTRAALGRAIEQLEGNWLQGLFNGYGRLFMKLTTAISRRQEYVADGLAARVAGAPAMRRALRQVTALAPAHQSYFANEVLPVLRSGFLPPVTQGFELFRSAANIREATDRIVDETMTTGQTGEFDTHPTLRERLEALEVAAAGSDAEDDSASALTLIDEPESLGRDLLQRMIGEENVAGLKAVAWDELGALMWTPQWMGITQHYQAFLRPIHADALPTGSGPYITLGSQLVERSEINVNSDERIRRAVQVLSIAFACLLLRRGWTLRSDMGAPVLVVRGAESINPFAEIQSLADGTESRDRWMTTCERLGIVGASLAPDE
jgi:Zn-dependent protease with chaperone function